MPQYNYKAGEECNYLNRQGATDICTITKVHYDDPPEPYYTIRIDGHERETVGSRLRPLSEAPLALPSPARDEEQVKKSHALLELADRSPDAAALFKAIDHDGDGAITCRELAAYFKSTDDEFARRLLKAIDVDDDGLIDPHEFRVAHKWARNLRQDMRTFFSSFPADYLFTTIDANSDGLVSKEELAAYMGGKLCLQDPEGEAQRLFAIIDKDGNGMIDREEFMQAHEKMSNVPLAHTEMSFGYSWYGQLFGDLAEMQEYAETNGLISSGSEYQVLQRIMVSEGCGDILPPENEYVTAAVRHSASAKRREAAAAVATGRVCVE